MGVYNMPSGGVGSRLTCVMCMPAQVWLMTSMTVGSDLLANVAAALAATSQLMSPIDPGYSALALNMAQYVWPAGSHGVLCRLSR